MIWAVASADERVMVIMKSVNKVAKHKQLALPPGKEMLEHQLTLTMRTFAAIRR